MERPLGDTRTTSNNLAPKLPKPKLPFSLGECGDGACIPSSHSSSYKAYLLAVGACGTAPRYWCLGSSPLYEQS